MKQACQIVLAAVIAFAASKAFTDVGYAQNMATPPTRSFTCPEEPALPGKRRINPVYLEWAKRQDRINSVLGLRNTVEVQMVLEACALID